MLKINIICPGKTKEKAYQILEEKFTKLLSPYAKINWIHTKEFHQQKNQAIEDVRQKEGEELLKKLPEQGYTIVLDEHGKEMHSEKFAKLLDEQQSKGETINFIIGGTFGLSQELKSRAYTLLSLSKMTLTHEMCRSILLEQIYRGICISKGKKYHY